MNTFTNVGEITKRIDDMPARWRADEDFRRAIAARDLARFHLRWKTPGWRLDHRIEMRRAMRFWKHYAEAVRRAAL